MADIPWWLLAAALLASAAWHWWVLGGPEDSSGPARNPGGLSPLAARGAGPEDLTPAEHAMLASLALRYACADPAAGRQLADYLRTKCPGVSDADLMRAVIALGHAARYFNRRELTATDALAAYLHAMSGAALDLTDLHRSEMPRQ